jgi:SAM-dependent methyltransferase
VADAVAGYEYVGSELSLFSSAVNWKSYFAGLLRHYISGRVLEAGAGIGATTCALWSESVSSWTCLEPDERLVIRLVNATRGLEPPVVPLIGTLESLRHDLKFDTILYIDVLEHIEDDAGELLRASRHLAPGGFLIVLSPAFQWLYSEFDQALGHFRRYSSRTLSAAFPSHLRKISVVYADPVGALLSLGNRVALRRSAPSARQIALWDRVIIPISRAIDRPFRHWFGRSVIAIYSNPE